MKQILGYRELAQIGVYIEIVDSSYEGYKLFLDPRLKLKTKKGEVLAKKLKSGDEIVYENNTLCVMNVRKPKVFLLSSFLTKINTVYPKVKILKDKSVRVFTEKELINLMNKTGYKIAYQEFDGIVLESVAPGYFSFLPGSILDEDTDGVIRSDNPDIESWRF